LLARGAVKDEPESCSAYNPKGVFCGEFCPTGSAPGIASLSW
jgi:NADPH-dependent glutamate synthase beta subunit-like oxidoreductase